MIRYGVAGWSYDDWHGPVYPRRKPKDFHPLPFLARFIDLMELNSSFYALPRPDYAERWVQLLEPHPEFRFTAKLHSGFTHGPFSEITAAAAEAFRLGLSPLADAGRLLGLLVQFPVTFQQTEAGWARLERIRELFPSEALTLELRHRSWFSTEAFDRLRRLAYGVAHIDLPSARDHPPPEHSSLRAPAYLRLHGRNAASWFDPQAGRDDRYDYRYARAEVDVLAKQLKLLTAKGDDALLVSNNHFGGQALAATLEIKGAMEGTAPLAPASLIDTYPDLREHLQSDGQQRLF